MCTTEQGQVSGRLSPSGVASFLGIPYASAPAFAAPPVPVEPWEGVRPAVAYGPTVAKAPYPPPLNALIPENSLAGEPGESPLNLNVWTPSPDPESHLPVMVWIHGGAFANGSGSASAYDGSAFARDGVVFVTLNYRLGTEGFLHLDGVPDNRACSTRSPPWSGYGRTSPPSEATRTASPSSASRPVRWGSACCWGWSGRAGCSGGRSSRAARHTTSCGPPPPG